MCAEHGDASGDQIQQHAADRRVGGQPLHGRKGDRVMRDDQFGAGLDGFRGAGRRDRQAGHHFRDAPVAMADQQPDIVPILGQSEGGELFKERSDRGDGGHERFSWLDVI